MQAPLKHLFDDHDLFFLFCKMKYLLATQPDQGSGDVSGEKNHVENHVSGDKPEIKQKVTSAQIVPGGQIGSADRS